MSQNKFSIMVIDDHPIIHEGIKILLSAESDIELSDIAASAKEAMEKLAKGLPDLVIADLSLDDSDGTYLIQQLHTTYPSLRVLVYTMSEERLFAERVAMAGAAGYVMKTTSSSKLMNSIRAILSGQTSFSPGVLQQGIERVDGIGLHANSVLDCLSNRQLDIFKMLGEGMNSSQISEKLGISRNTVDTHRINMKNKLNLPNGKALERLAFEVIKQQKLP